MDYDQNYETDHEGALRTTLPLGASIPPSIKEASMNKRWAVYGDWRDLDDGKQPVHACSMMEYCLDSG